MTHHPKLTSSELAVLWGAYQNSSLIVCTVSYFLKTVEDEEVRSLLKYTSGLAIEHVEILKEIFKEENHPIPMGFTEQDVNLNADRLFTDTFMLFYLSNVGSMGLNSYGISLPSSSRKVIRDYFSKCLSSAIELYNRVTDVMQEKGVYVRSPHIPYPEQVEFVHKQHFLAGWFGNQRPLTSNEINFLFNNLQRNVLGMGMLTGFSQVTNSAKVSKYFTRGAEIAKHHCAVFSKFLDESNILTPMSSDNLPTSSKQAPFSDKLMMYHTAGVQAAGIGFYGMSLATSPRRDLAASYTRLMAEAGEYTEDGANIMIENGWMEQPPTAPNRKDLARG
ncbi:DUF3231 family protein [Aquibacillus rhizosphaerae]|uniref:DUF3231 family protein n=1 Tax=Aquibacillus rhizosphaerae TaxID=3051431 RepID=A0ABT7L9Z4_9BACI|nr:DUF3231 family protein [Aquibacillus sp. LR5S19]MDL4842673.1 DUF3231 family protein [Aquibacillus sp. LR5S19]